MSVSSSLEYDRDWKDFEQDSGGSTGRYVGGEEAEKRRRRRGGGEEVGQDGLRFSLTSDL